MSPGTTWAGKLSSRSRSASLRNPVGTAISPGIPAPGVLTNEGLRESSGDAITTTPKPGFSILEIFYRNRFLGIVRVR
jgi:hypothetical protein